MSDEAVDRLYALPLEEFTPARDALAKEIRRAGDREAAAVVAKLPKPTPAAWTANQLAREQPDVIEAVLEAGAELRSAQEAAVGGGGGPALRDATAGERRAVEAAMTAAGAYRPGGKPLSRAMAERLRTTLHAAASDDAIRDALAAGRLVDEAQAGGAWPFALETTASAPAPRERKKRRSTRQEGERRRAEKAAEREKADAERAALVAELDEARADVRVRQRQVAVAEREAKRARKSALDAAAALERARREADEAQSGADDAERLLAEAQDALQSARDIAARLEERLD